MKNVFYFLLLLIFSTTKSWASLTLLQHRNSYCASATSCSVTVTPTGANNLLIIKINNFTIERVSDGFSNFKIYTNNPFNIGAYYYLPLSHSGVTTVTAYRRPSGGAGGIPLEFWEVSGFIYPINDSGTGTSSGVQSGGSSTLPTITTASINEFIVTAISSNGTPSAMSGSFTFDDNTAGATQNSYGHLIATSPGTYTPIFTDSGTSFSADTVSFKEGLGAKVNQATLNQAQINS